MKILNKFVTNLSEYLWLHRVARLLFWLFVLSFLARLLAPSFFNSVCPTDTFYGFLEVSCRGFPFADMVNRVLYFFANIVFGSAVAMLVMVQSVSTAVRYLLYSAQDVCPAFVTENINGQLVTIPTQLACPTFVSTVTDVVVGVVAGIGVLLAILYAAHLLTRFKRWAHRYD